MRNNKVTTKLPKYNSLTLNSFAHIAPSVGTSTLLLFIFLVPQIVMLFATKSFSSLYIVFASVTASLLADFVHTINNKDQNFNWLISSIQGILIGFLLPETYNPIAIFFVAFCCIILTKYAFGGFAASWVNAVAVTVAVAFFINMSSFPVSPFTRNDLQGRNPALILIQNGIVPLTRLDSKITAGLNNSIFKLFGLSIPEGYVSLLWDTHSVIPAFRFNLITLISSIILFAFDFVDIVIPAIFIAVYSLLIRFAGPLVVQGIMFQGDIILALLTSGTLFGNLFLIQWYGTTPITLSEKIIYGILSGIMAFLIVGYGMSSVGFVFTVLLMNLLTPCIQIYESKKVKKHLIKVLVPRINQLKEEENV